MLAIFKKCVIVVVEQIKNGKEIIQCSRGKGGMEYEY